MRVKHSSKLIKFKDVVVGRIFSSQYFVGAFVKISDSNTGFNAKHLNSDLEYHFNWGEEVHIMVSQKVYPHNKTSFNRPAKQDKPHIFLFKGIWTYTYSDQWKQKQLEEGTDMRELNKLGSYISGLNLLRTLNKINGKQS